MKFMLSIALICLMFQSCISNSQTDNKNEITTNLYRNEETAFDSCMEQFSAKYKLGNSFLPMKESKFHEIYPLRKRIYLPGLKGLTFDYRALAQTTDADAPVIHIYNDSINFVLPFTDFQFYKWNKENDVKIDTNSLTLNVEFNNLMWALNFGNITTENREDILLVLRTVMSFFDAEKIAEESDLSYFKSKAKKYIENSTYLTNKKCATAGKENILAVENEFRNGKKFIYSNGALIVFFSFSKDKLTTEVLKPDCIPLYRTSSLGQM